jgi:hypothetical protein
MGEEKIFHYLILRSVFENRSSIRGRLQHIQLQYNSVYIYPHEQ